MKTDRIVQFASPIVAVILLVEIFLLICYSAYQDRIVKESPMRGHSVLIGTAVDPALLSESQYIFTLVQEFDMVEAENSMKWATIHPAKNIYDFRAGDDLLNFAEKHGMKTRGHCLLWRLALPKWLGAADLKMDQVLHDHIRTVVSHYRGRVFAWDVVNEAFASNGSLENSHWYNRPGINVGPGTAYIEMAFRWARESDASAKLFYNDFGAEEINAKSDAIYAMVKDFKRRGIPIDGVGFQTHLTLEGLNIQSFRANMERFVALGVEVHITELDVAIPKHAVFGYARQARVYQSIFKACLETQGCTAIQVWGFTDKHSWIPGNTAGRYEDANLFDASYTPKPALVAVKSALTPEL
jgi:endo-1,4-beta-xylanase